jgi:hypothetical protein
MSPLSAAIIATNYPEQIRVSWKQNGESKLYGGIIYLMRGKHIHRIIVEHTECTFEAAEAAEASMLKVVKQAQDYFEKKEVCDEV